MIRRTLDRLYALALGLSCLTMVGIALLVLAQILGRLTDRALIAAGAEPLGLSIPSLSDFGGFLFVAGVSLALPATLRAAGHVRVTLLLNFGGPAVSRALTTLVLICALGLSGFAAWHVTAQAWDSFSFNAVSFGMVRVPLWIPQGVMAAGFILLAIAVLDELVCLLSGRTPAFVTAEAERREGGH